MPSVGPVGNTGPGRIALKIRYYCTKYLHLQRVLLQDRDLLNLRHLPGFADFILKNYLEEYVNESLKISRSIKIPLLKFFDSLPESQVRQIATQTSSEFLQYLAENRAMDQIQSGLKMWMQDQLPIISKGEIGAEDITMINYVRKEVLLHFIPLYTSDLSSALELVKEIDRFTLESETTSTSTYIRLLKDHIAEQLEFNENIREQLLEAQELAEIGSFEWDIINDTSQQTPQLSKIFELEKNQKLNEFLEKVHPEDRPAVESALNTAFNQTGLYDCEFRYLIKGKEKVLWSRGRVTFEKGIATKMKGTVMNVTERHKIVKSLLRSEALYKQAEALTHIGNYEWEIGTNKLTWTEELYRIYGLDPEKQDITPQIVGSFIHPDDLKATQDQMREAIREKSHFDFYYRIVLPGNKEKILHVRGEVIADPLTNEASRAIGTVQDVTEKQTLIRNLRRSDELYKQAQSISHLGNWTWNVTENFVEWTDEVYRIYGLVPQSEKIDYTRYLSFIHPEDLEKVTVNIEKALREQKPYDFYHRIILPDGTVKIVHSKGEIIKDSSGRVTKLVGTAQDVTERQELISSLQQSDALYRQAQAIAHIGNWTYNLEEDAMNWSDELYRIFGLETQSGEFASRDFMDMVHPDDRHLLDDIMEKTIAEPKAFDLFFRTMPVNDVSRTVHMKAEVLLDEDQKLEGMFGTMQDVTEQQMIEQQLRENQNFIQKIADATPSIITSYNINTGKYRFVSGGLEKLLGYSPSQPLEEGIAFFISVVHPDDLEPIMLQNQRAMELANQGKDNDSIVEFIYRMRHKSGEYRWFHTYGTIFDRNQEGKVEHVLNISIDITQQMKAEEKIEEQEYFIRHIADASPTILYLFDVRSGQVIYINKEIDPVLGYTPNEIIGLGNRAIPELYHPEDAVKMFDRLKEYNDPAHPKMLFQFECRMKHKNGEWRWLLVREIVFKRTIDGKISEVLGAALDITERREMEEELAQQKIELQQSNKSLEEYAYVASHDLKEPLRKISTFGDRLLGMKHSLDEEGRSYLDKMVTSSQRMQQMINDLLSVSMITANKSFQQYDLQNILDEIIQTLEFKIEELGAVVTSDKLPKANIDPSQFRQLFQNLLSNSLKFIRPNTVPEIKISHTYLSPADVRELNLTKANRYLQINFKDNGIGFDKKFSEKIFTIFQRLHTRSEYEGTGIGLAICRRITENHGGTIFARGEQGKGSEFSIIIPG